MRPRVDGGYRPPSAQRLTKVVKWARPSRRNISTVLGPTPSNSISQHLKPSIPVAPAMPGVGQQFHLNLDGKGMQPPGGGFIVSSVPGLT